MPLKAGDVQRGAKSKIGKIIVGTVDNYSELSFTYRLANVLN